MHRLCEINKTNYYSFYDTLALNVHDPGIFLEPDSREPWFMYEARNESWFNQIIAKFEQTVAMTIEQLKDPNYKPAELGN